MNSPIRIDMSGYCKNCKFADLYLEKEHISGFEEDTVNCILHCKHEQVCEYWNNIRKSESISSVTGMSTALNSVSNDMLTPETRVVDALNAINEGYLVSYDDLKNYSELNDTGSLSN